MIRCTPACSSFFKTSTRKVRKPVELQPEGIIWLLLLRFCSSLNHVITCVRDCRPTECHLVFSRCCCSMHLAPNHTQLRCIVATFRITSYRDMGVSVPQMIEFRALVACVCYYTYTISFFMLVSLLLSSQQLLCSFATHLCTLQQLAVKLILSRSCGKMDSLVEIALG